MKKRDIKIKSFVILLLIFCLGQVFAALCGDVNTSDSVDILDALLIAQNYVGIDTPNFDQAVADVNNDNSIDILDALLVAQYYVDLIDELNCDESTLEPTLEPTPGGLTTYEMQAEEAAWSSGGVESDHSGYTGSGYVNTNNASGEWIEWSVVIETATNASCVFIYACASDDRPMALTVNGNDVASLSFPASGAWTTWIPTGEAIFGLTAGENLIRLTATGSGGPANMDKMDITMGEAIVTPEPPTPSPIPTATPTPGPTRVPGTYDILVAADGSGDYTNVQDGVNAASSGDVILIKPGTYTESVKINKNNITLIGESRENTIITNDNDFDDGDDHACFYMTGNDITVVTLTLENTADSRLGRKQANALYVSGERTLFYKTNILGFQDTYRHSGGKRSYHLDCVIQGTTDFIYGDGIALFENCVIYNRKDSHVTAHAPGSKREFGYVFKDCDIRKHPDEVVTNASLGRPWGDNANVVYLNCALGGHIRADGWMVWNGRDTWETAYYAEYKSTGPGANPEARLSWTHQLTDSEAAKYTLNNILTDWDPEVIIASFQ